MLPMNGFLIRPFQESDISQTSELHRQVFELPEVSGQRDAYRTYFLNTFIENDWVRRECPPLVAVDSAGNVIGFLGVVARPMSLDGAPILAALSSQFIVAPEWRSRLAGIEILKRFLSGPQDLSFTDEAVERSTVIWERLGGVRSPAHSVQWLAPLRPAELLRWKWKQDGRHLLAAAGRSFAPAADRWISYPLLRSRRAAHSGLKKRPMDTDILRQNMTRLRNDWHLIPDYNRNGVERLFAVARSRKKFGEFRSVCLEDATGKCAGWYMYYANPGAIRYGRGGRVSVAR
jgi:hypothetical protein